MDRRYALILKAVCGTLLNMALFFFASAQDSGSTESSILRIKVTERTSNTLESNVLTRNANGHIVTGIQSFDQFNQLFKVYEFRRVFPHAGKNEPKHRKYGLHRWYELRMNVPGKVLDAVASYNSLQQVEKAEPAYKKSINGAGKHKIIFHDSNSPNSIAPVLPAGTNDPMFASQWHYSNTGQTGGLSGADIKILEGWKTETGKRNVIVAVMDGGVEASHPDLQSNMWRNENEMPGNNIDDDGNGYVDDINGYNFVLNSGRINAHFHGTHVAGTIAAATNNGIGVAGVAGGSGNNDGVRIMTCAIFDDNDDDGQKDAAAAYVYAADHGAVISQNSWGYTAPNVYEQTILDAIDYFIAEAGKDGNGNQTGPMSGGLVIFSAGNEASESRHYPGYYPPVLSVASTNHSDVKSYYSNYGSWVDVSAPGGETNSVETRGVLSTLTGGKYGYLQGTSMACPHVSGVAALILSKFGRTGFSPDALRKRLSETAQNIDVRNSAYAGKLGTGRIDAARALTAVDNIPPAAIADLHIVSKALGVVTLEWTAPNDPGGFIANYDLRYSRTSISAANFMSATTAGDVPVTAAPGEKQRFTVRALPGETRIFFAVKSVDFEGNISLISNTVSVVTAPAPRINLSSTSITHTLATAETGTRTITVSNDGGAPLDFRIVDAGEEGDRVVCTPASGSIAPGGSTIITFTFNASGLSSGTHTTTFTLTSNDPVSSEVDVDALLTVTPNGSPIAQFDDGGIMFKGVHVDSSKIRYFRIYNAGSEPLRLTSITFAHPQFSSTTPVPAIVDPFEELEIPIQFKPSSPAVVTSTMRIQMNDRNNPLVAIDLVGEGLNSIPIVLEPSALSLILQKGTISKKTLTLTNNSSFSRSFRIEPLANELPGIPREPDPEWSDEGRSRPELEHPNLTRQELIEKLQAGEIKLDPLLQPLKEPQTKQSSSGRDESSELTAIPGSRYETNFEEFRTGSLTGQNGWVGLQGWEIATSNPENGNKHLRGTALTSGAQTFAVTPEIYDEDSHIPDMYTTFAAVVNFDEAAGSQWDIVVQDIWFVATRIRVNADRTMDVLTVGPRYNSIWNRLDLPELKGYVDVAVEFNISGDGATGFSVFYVFINGARVFKGYGLGSYVSSAAFVNIASKVGSYMDVDSVVMRPGRYTPRYIKAIPAEGIIPANQSVKIDVEFDPAGLHFAEYDARIIAHIDEFEKVEVPAEISVMAPGALNVQAEDVLYLDSEYGWTGFYISNVGGEPANYTIETALNYPWLQINNKSGTIAASNGVEVTLEFSVRPNGGYYYDTLLIKSNVSIEPVSRIPITIVVKAEETYFVTSGNQVHFELSNGSSLSQDILVWKRNRDPNDLEEYVGVRDVGYRFEIPADAPFISISPGAGTVRGNELDKVSITFDASMMDHGIGSTYFNIVNTTISTERIRVDVSYNIFSSDDEGKIMREVWSGIAGQEVRFIPVGQPPSAREFVQTLGGPTNAGDHYGARLSGLIEAPITGSYIFYLSSDDDSELWLSTDRDPTNKKRVAYLTTAVPVGVYSKYSSQKSSAITLEAGKKYYVEVLHKEHLGDDHVSVAWRLPNGIEEYPIPASRISLANPITSNEIPVVRLLSPANSQAYAAPAKVLISASAIDNDGSVAKVEFFSGDSKIGEDMSPPYELLWTMTVRGKHRITARATDNQGGVASASSYVYIVRSGCVLNGFSLTREVWRDIGGGNYVSDVPFNTPPTEISYLTSFESPSNNGDHYGSRVRGYICIWTTGLYRFFIASDNRSELWLSTDDNPLNKKLIAQVAGYTAPLQWYKYSSQYSREIQLTAGRRYYIEALHKESTASDHLAVGMASPTTGENEAPLSFIRIHPFINGHDVETNGALSEMAYVEDGENLVQGVTLFPNPAGRGVVTVGVPAAYEEWDVDVSVTTVTGTELLKQDYGPAESSEISFVVDDSFAPGIYVVKVKQGNKSYVKRLMVK